MDEKIGNNREENITKMEDEIDEGEFNDREDISGISDLIKTAALAQKKEGETVESTLFDLKKMTELSGLANKKEIQEKAGETRKILENEDAVKKAEERKKQWWKFWKKSK